MIRIVKTALFLISLAWIVACSGDDDKDPEVKEDPFLAGDLTNEMVSYFDVDQSFLLDVDKNVVLDLEEDGVDDLLITVDVDDTDQIQDIRILPVNGLLLGAVSLGEFNGEPTSMVSAIAEGTRMESLATDWSSGQLLFAYRSRNQSLVPYSISASQLGYLPTLRNERVGWISFELTRAEPDISQLATLRFSTFAQLDQP